MEHVNYSFALPLDHSNRLEVSLKIIDEHSNAINGISQPDNSTFKDDFFSPPVELLNLNELPAKIIQIIRTAHTTISKRFSQQQSFMVSTSKGFQLLRMNQIVCFDYLNEKRLWMVQLSNQTNLLLKRYTIAEDILNYSPGFIQINHHQIINLDYLVKIDEHSCQLSQISGENKKYIISRIYLKELRERVEVI